MIGGEDSPSIAQDVVLRGNLAYVADDEGGLQVYDISNPTHVVLRGKVNSLADRTVDAVGLYANYLLTFCNRLFGYWKSIQVLDLSNPLQPPIVGSLALNDWVGQIEVDGSLAYLSYNSALAILDLANPRAPQFLSVLLCPTGVGRFVLRDHYVFMAGTTAGMFVIDVADPAHPAIASSLSSGYWPGSIALYGDRAYLGGDYNYYWIVDIADPLHPRTIGFRPLNDPGSNYRYMSDLLVVGDKLISGENDRGIRIRDLTDRDAPVRIGSVSTSHVPLRIRLYDGLLYVADYYQGLRVIEIGNGHDPQALAVTPADTGPYFAAGIGDIALVSDSNSGLSVWDMTDPAAPTRLPAAMSGRTHRIVVDGAIGLLAETDSGAVVVDLSRPAEPVRRGSVPLSHHMADAALDGSIAYVAGGTGGLEVLDLADPDHPAKLATVAIPSFDNYVTIANCLARIGRHVLVGMNSTNACGIRVYDCADPAHPAYAGQCSLRVHPWDIVMKGNTALIASADAGIELVDCSDPANPVPVRLFHPGGRTCQLTLDGDLLYASSWYGGLSIIDVSNPLDPRIVGAYRDAWAVSDVAVTTKALVVVDSPAGLRVLPRECVGTPIVLSSFRAQRRNGQAIVHWQVSTSRGGASYHVWRQEPGHDRTRISQTALGGRETYDFVDANPPASSVDYWLAETSTSGVEHWYGPAQLAAAGLPLHLRLYPNNPNPFNPRTTLRFDLPRSGKVRLAVYDLAGRLVRELADRTFPAGIQRLDWDGRDARGRLLPSGAYFARLESGGKVQTLRMSLVR